MSNADRIKSLLKNADALKAMADRQSAKDAKDRDEAKARRNRVVMDLHRPGRRS